MYIPAYLFFSSTPGDERKSADRYGTIDILDVPLFHQYFFGFQAYILDY